MVSDSHTVDAFLHFDWATLFINGEVSGDPMNVLFVGEIHGAATMFAIDLSPHAVNCSQSKQKRVTRRNEPPSIDYPMPSKLIGRFMSHQLAG